VVSGAARPTSSASFSPTSCSVRAGSIESTLASLASSLPTKDAAQTAKALRLFL
jgi:hypothetical protein